MAVVCATRVSIGFLRPICGRYSDRINATSMCWRPSPGADSASRNVFARGTFRDASSRGTDVRQDLIGGCSNSSERTNDTDLFCISHQNIGGAMKKKLPELLSSKRDLADVIIWTEIGLRPENKRNIEELVTQLSYEYRIFFNCRRNCARASGGVAILVRKDVDFEVDELISNEVDWMLAGKLRVPGRRDPLGIIGCYIPHKSSTYYERDMFNQLGSVFQELSETSHGVLVLGDINRRLGDGQGCPDRSFLKNFRRRTKDTGGSDGPFLTEFSDKFDAYFLNGRVYGNIPAKPTNSIYEKGVKIGGTEVDYALGDLIGFSSAVYMDVGRVNKRISHHSEIKVHLRVRDVPDEFGFRMQDM